MVDFKASHRFAKITARKARLVVDQVRGMPVSSALDVLNFSNKKGAVQPATIAGVREQLQGRDAAFSGKELRARFSK